MQTDILHRVDSVGRQRSPDAEKPFDPRLFEQAIHGLQQLTLDLVRLDDYTDDDDYNPTHERITDDDGRGVLALEENTLLHDISRALAPRWDASVLIDQEWEHSYAIRTSVDCGGEILVYATVFIQDGILRKFTVGHTDLLDIDDTAEVTDLDTHSSSRVVTHVNRFFERSVTQAYAHTIPSAATAFDFIATKADRPPTGSRPAQRRKRRESLSQREWAETRGKTQQTVSDNVRDARHHLPGGDPDLSQRGPALEELDPNADETGDIRLV